MRSPQHISAKDYKRPDERDSIEVWTEHLPPSTNNLFVNVPGKGRIRSQRYREWQQAAGWDFNGKGHISGPFTLAITVCSSKRRKGRDLSNFVKSLEDLAVKHGLVDDDSLAESVTISWGEARGGVAMFFAKQGVSQ